MLIPPQEIAAVSASLGNGPITEYEPVTAPSTGVVVDALHWLMQRYTTCDNAPCCQYTPP